jgi:hypothetical protein
MDDLCTAAAVEAEMAMELSADAAFQPQEARLLGDGKGPPRPERTSTSASVYPVPYQIASTKLNIWLIV